MDEPEDTDFDKNMTIEEVFAEADRRSKMAKVTPNVPEKSVSVSMPTIPTNSSPSPESNAKVASNSSTGSNTTSISSDPKSKPVLAEKVKLSFEDLLSSGDKVIKDVRRSRRHDASLKKIVSKHEIDQKTVKIDSSNIIPNVRRSSRANKGKGKEIFDPSDMPSRTQKVLKLEGDEKPKPHYVYETESSSEEEAEEEKKTVTKNNKTTATGSKGKSKKEFEDNLPSSDGEDISSDSDDDDSYNDPNRLWCICKKPHDDRFMISCDQCQEWYHGDCVGITVQLGKQMERRGEEYVCPKCKNKSSKKQKSGVKLKGYAAHDHHVNKKAKKDHSLEKGRQCIVTSCKNAALDDSVYCSNVCILRHARESLQTKMSSPKHEKKKLDKETRKEKARERLTKKISDSANLGRVAVFCCDTGKILSSVNAPLKTELNSFLTRHPSYQILRLKKPLSTNQNKDLKMQSSNSTYGFDPDYNPIKGEQPPAPQNQTDHKPRKHKLDSHHRRPSDETKKSKKAHHEHHRRHSTESKTSKVTSHKSRSHEKDSKSDKKSNAQEDTVRTSVRKTLRDILGKRSEKSTDLKMHPSSIEKLVKKVEESLYKAYGGVSFKYKSKYRSIMFNLKDEKNEGFWRKVIVGEVTTSSLVKMTAEEMASKELAKWREHELTQELELINKLETEKKSERPVAKITHKGEIELDEDLSDLTHSHMGEKFSPTNVPSRIRRISSNYQDDKELKNISFADTTDQHNEHLFDMNCRICTGQVKEKNTAGAEAAKSVKRSTSIILSNEAQTKVPEELTTEKILQGITSKINKDTVKSSIPSPTDDDNSNDEDDAEITATTPPDSPPNEDGFNNSFKAETPPKLHSSYIAKTPEKKVAKPDPSDHVWSGTVTMPELSSFSTNAYVVCGKSNKITPCMPQELMLDGRIHPRVVWDYIGKVKALPNKEVCVIQFHAASEDDKTGYIAMLSYFSSRKRFGVVNNQNPVMIKDIYLVPLLETQPVPHQLLSLKGLKFPENRHSMLLGVLVLCKSLKRPMTAMEKLGLPPNISKQSYYHHSKKETPQKSQNKNIASHSAPSLTTTVEPRIPALPSKVSEEEYNPETADFDDLDASEPYDPEAYDPGDEPKSDLDDSAPYDPEQETEAIEFPELQALKDKQAFLEEMKQKLDAQKAELDNTTRNLQVDKKPSDPRIASDPRKAARLRQQSTVNSDTPLQKILSVLNMEKQ